MSVSVPLLSVMPPAVCRLLATPAEETVIVTLEPLTTTSLAEVGTAPPLQLAALSQFPVLPPTQETPLTLAVRVEGVALVQFAAVAEIVTEPAPMIVTGTLVWVSPALTVTADATVATVGCELVRFTVSPPDGAAGLSDRVRVVLEPSTVALEGLSDRVP